jgi:HK97 family phage major capsid protein
MPYTNQVTRTDAAALVPEEVSDAILTGLNDTSAALARFRRIPVSAAQVRLPILSALPIAYWISGDTGLKQTTEMAWSNKFLNIEEIAAVAPIPENVLEDVLDQGNLDIWGELEPTITTEIARVLDSAVFFGINAPATFPQNIAAAAAAAGNAHTEGSAVAAGGIQDDLDATQGLVEADGFDADGIVAVRTLRGKLRRLRNTLGDRMSGTDPALTEYNGLPISYPMRGLWPTTTGSPEAFVGEFADQFVIGVRRDITMKLLDQAVIQDNTGAIIYNLAQQDMVAMRFTFRVGWQVSNRITFDQPTAASRYPVGVMTLP